MTGTVDGVDRLVTVSELQHELKPVYEVQGHWLQAPLRFGPGKRSRISLNGLSKRIVDEQLE